MVTKYDVKDEVLVKAKVHKIISDKRGEVAYLLDIDGVASYVKFEEKDIVGLMSVEGIDNADCTR